MSEKQMNAELFGYVRNTVGFAYANYMHPDDAYHNDDGIITVEIDDDDMELIDVIAKSVYVLFAEMGYIDYE